MERRPEVTEQRAPSSSLALDLWSLATTGTQEWPSRDVTRRSQFTIIAGPNGAGKSRLCPFYVSAKSFDGDKLMLDLRREHPDWPDRWVSSTSASSTTSLSSTATATTAIS